jgi:hypothetical protein
MKCSKCLTFLLVIESETNYIPSTRYRKSLSSSSIWRQLCNGSITGHLVLREYNRVTFREFTQTRDIYVSHFE